MLLLTVGLWLSVAPVLYLLTYIKYGYYPYFEDEHDIMEWVDFFLFAPIIAIVTFWESL